MSPSDQRIAVAVEHRNGMSAREAGRPHSAAFARACEIARQIEESLSLLASHRSRLPKSLPSKRGKGSHRVLQPFCYEFAWGKPRLS